MEEALYVPVKVTELGATLDMKTLRQAIARTFVPQIVNDSLDFSDGVNCEACGRKTPSTRAVRALNIPDFVRIVLHRFDGGLKHTNLVTAPDVLSGQDMHGPEQQHQLQWKLVATIRHIDSNTPTSGHYVTRIRQLTHVSGPCGQCGPMPHIGISILKYFMFYASCYILDS
jgi:ubiquitin C-terminal hydrolase